MELNKAQIEAIAQTIYPRCTVVRSSKAEGGMSAEMTLVAVMLEIGQQAKFLIRRFKNLSERESLQKLQREYETLQFLKKTTIPAPQPLLFDSSKSISAEAVLALRYIEGESKFTFDDPPSCLGQLAHLLAQIHTIGESHGVLSFLPEPKPSSFDFVVMQEGSLHSEQSLSLVIERVRGFEHLKSSNPKTLLHGDFWPGNALWKEGMISGVIDWEDACLGEPLIDLATGRLEIAMIFGIQASNYFTEVYRSTRKLNYSHLPYWDLLASERFRKFFESDLKGFVEYFKIRGLEKLTETEVINRFKTFVRSALQDG